MGFNDLTKMYIMGWNSAYYRIEFEGGNIRYYKYRFKIQCMNTLVVLLNSADTSYLSPVLNGPHSEDLTYDGT